jgi:hypothetical protein
MLDLIWGCLEISLLFIDVYLLAVIDIPTFLVTW